LDERIAALLEELLLAIPLLPDSAPRAMRHQWLALAYTCKASLHYPPNLLDERGRGDPVEDAGAREAVELSDLAKASVDQGFRRLDAIRALPEASEDRDERILSLEAILTYWRARSCAIHQCAGGTTAASEARAAIDELAAPRFRVVPPDYWSPAENDPYMRYILRETAPGSG
jgi:hypothetical protein